MCCRQLAFEGAKRIASGSILSASSGHLHDCMQTSVRQTQTRIPMYSLCASVQMSGLCRDLGQPSGIWTCQAHNWREPSLIALQYHSRSWSTSFWRLMASGEPCQVCVIQVLCIGLPNVPQDALLNEAENNT